MFAKYSVVASLTQKIDPDFVCLQTHAFLTYKGKKIPDANSVSKKVNNGLTDCCHFLSELMHKKVICTGFQACLAFSFDFIGFCLDTDNEPHLSSCTQYYI